MDCSEDCYGLSVGFPDDSATYYSTFHNYLRVLILWTCVPPSYLHQRTPRFNGLNIQAGCQPEPFEPSRLTCWWDCSYLGERALAPLAASFCSVSVSCGFGQIDSRRLVIDPVGGAGNHWDGHAVETFEASMSLTDQAGTDTAARCAKLGIKSVFRPL